jgi:hypothetical protein
MRNASKRKRRARRRRLGFQLAETMAAVSQMALLSPCSMDAWTQQLSEADRDRRRPEPRL